VHRLFVYGSLKRGLSNAFRLRGAECLDADARAEGYALIRYVAGYPGLARDPERSARGELFLVEDAVLAELDEFEECPDVYYREKILVRLSDGTLVEAFAYIATDGEVFDVDSRDAWEPPSSLTPFESR
jgi:gamma-glutamylcyclotransferase (GGCT)/AIG2-like uncharacterized protein YtfP